MARTIAKDHDAKRAHILGAAARVFSAEGFDRASMTRLAKECGVSKANIYHYYDSKDAILFDLLDAHLSGLAARIDALDLEGLAPEDRLRRTISEVLQAYEGADDEHQVQLTAMSALPAAQQDILRGYQRALVRHMSDCLAAAAPETFADDKAKLRAAAMSVFGMLNWHYMWNAGAGPDARQTYADLVSDLTLGGLNAI